MWTRDELVRTGQKSYKALTLGELRKGELNIAWWESDREGNQISLKSGCELGCIRLNCEMLNVSIRTVYMAGLAHWNHQLSRAALYGRRTGLMTTSSPTSGVNYPRSINTKANLRTKIRHILGTTRLPTGGNAYGNGALIVPVVARGYHTTTVMRGERKVKQPIQNLKDVSPDYGRRVQKVRGKTSTSTVVIDRKSLLDRKSTTNEVKIYRDLIKPESLLKAYEAVSSKASANTLATTNETLDGTSLTTLAKLHNELSDHSFKFKPIRRVDIPKKDGKTRPLGIPNPRDKVVQKAICNKLEEIYEGKSIFHGTSHGFRPGRSTHTALAQVTKWTGVNWFIEGDISAFFDTIDHKILIELIGFEVSDSEFEDIIWKGIKCRYVNKLTKSETVSKVGTPQGGVISPILSNIYLHELDLFVNQEFVEPSKTSGKTSKPNPKYTKIHTQISNKRQKLSPNYRYKKIITGTDRADVLAEIKSLEKRRAELRSSIDGDGFRIYYVRYADDFLIGVNGTYERAVKIRARIAEFLKEHLKLSLNMEKTKITSASEGRAAFLGADIRRYSSRIHDQKRVKRVTSVGVTRQRVPNSNIIALAPIEKLLKKLSEQGMCKIRNFRNRDVRSTSKSAWVNMPVEDIVLRYNLVWQGILNYYSFAYNRSQLNFIQYLLEDGLARTLANKLKLKRRAKVFKKFGKPIKIKYTVIKTKGEEPEEREIAFRLEKNLKRLNRYKKVVPYNVWNLFDWSPRTRERWNSPCIICQSDVNVEMHHRRPLNASKTDTTLKGINRNLSRKQIPLCRKCHNRVHSGKYDGPGIY